jgi:uncharacterized delta-60 repeat protein
MITLNNARRSHSALLRASQVVIEAVESRTLLSASVSGTVYFDINGDGIHQSSEPTSAGQLIYADLNNNGKFDSGEPEATPNNQTGVYTLNNVPAGFTIIREQLAYGQRQSAPSGGNGQHITVGNSPIKGVDFEVTYTPYLAGTVYADNNGNGVQDPGEADIANATVYVDQGDTGVYRSGDPTAITNANGYYAFNGLMAATYTLRTIGSARLVEFTGATVTLSQGQVVLNENIAIPPLVTTGTVQGTVYPDVNGDGYVDPGDYLGVAGRTVYDDLNNNGILDAGEPFTVSGADGAFTLTGLPFGPSIIRQVVPAGMRQTAPAGGGGQHLNITTAPILNLIFQTSSDIYISGTVFHDTNSDGTQQSGEAPYAAARVYVDNNNDGLWEPGSAEEVAFTNAAGQYSFSDLPAGTYTIRVENSNTQPIGNALTVTLPSGGVNIAANFAVKPVNPGPAITSAGNLDPAFGNGESEVYLNSSNQIWSLPNGQYLIGAEPQNAPVTLARYNANGTLDTSFGKGGYAATNGSIGAVLVQGNGDIVVSGNNYGTVFQGDYLERFTPAGKLDTTFGPNHTGIESFAYGYLGDNGAFDANNLLALPNGQFILGGSANYGDVGDGRIALERFSADGIPDTTFGGNGTGYVTTEAFPSGQPSNENNCYIEAMSLDPNGNIVIAGVGSGPGTTVFVQILGRYTANGTLDTTFGPNGTGFVYNSTGQGMLPRAMRVLSNGQIVIAGAFVNVYGSTSTAQIADAYSLRYNADGSLDSSYGPNGLYTPSNSVNNQSTAYIYPDGSVLFGGADSYLGAVLFKVDPQGHPDKSFNGGSSEYATTDTSIFASIAVTSDGRILVLGAQTNFAFQANDGSAIFRFLGSAAPAPGSMLLSSGTLLVSGSGQDDIITVSKSGDGKYILANVNGVVNQFSTTSVKGIEVQALGGDDSVSITSAITINSTIFGGDGSDTLSGGGGNDVIYGNNGNDVLYGNAGNDTLYGGKGDDSLNGGAGNDVMYGQAGNDTLNGELGDDSFYGGSGNNTADFSDRTDNLQLHIGFGRLGAKGENDYIANDIETLIGGSGNDTLNAGTGYDELIAGSGNDTLISGHGGATLIGGSGNDLFESKNNKFDTITGGSGDNTAITDAFDIVTNVQHRTT